MVWRLELVRNDDGKPLERVTVFELGEIGAPVDLGDVGDNFTTAQRVMRAL